MSKIWKKSKKIKMNKVIEIFLIGDDAVLDMQLAKYDIYGSMGHLCGLLEVKIINQKEFELINIGLEKILIKIINNQLNISIDEEDIHTVIENELFNEIGEVAGKLHTMRSRNDQIAVDIKLYVKDHLSQLMKKVDELSKDIFKLAKLNKKLPMPGYTHMQPAMPSTVSLWLNSIKESLESDFNGLKIAYKMNDISPLGSAAGYGGPIKINRKLVASKLSFSKFQNNYLYCQNNRGKNELNVVHAIYQVMMTINKFSSDALLFSMKEFSFISLPDDFLTGSSMMVQKKNYDIFELLKSKSGIVSGNLIQIMMISNNLNSGYNRNFQDLKFPLLHSFDIIDECLNVMIEIINNLKFSKSNLEKAMTSELYITNQVYNEVKKGIPFRSAYKKVASKLK